MHPILTKFFILCLLFSGCDKHDTVVQYTYQTPEILVDGLAISSLEEVGIDSELISAAVEKIMSNAYGEIHSLLIYKDNMLVLEEYFPGHAYLFDAPEHYGDFVTWGPSVQHCVHSVTKSITSLCIGIAIDKGFIESIDQSIFDYLPDCQYLKTNENKDITIEHLLSMSSGLQWDEWNSPLSSTDNDQIAIWLTDKSPAEFVLSRPVIHDPGSTFNYSGGNLEIIAEILKKYIFPALI